MSDVSVYKRCLISYAAPSGNYTAGEIRAASEPGPTANPAYWIAISDADMTGGKLKTH